MAVFPPGAAQGHMDKELNMSEMETLRMFVTDRLTAAVDDILGVFGRTVAQYQELIDRQRLQLGELRCEEEEEGGGRNHTANQLQAVSWMKPYPEDEIISVPLHHTDWVDKMETSTAHIKTEECSEDNEVSKPNSDFDPSAVSETAIDCHALAEFSKPEDDENNSREAAGLWNPEEAEKTEGQCSSHYPEVNSSTDILQKNKPTHQPLLVFSCKVCGESFQKNGYLLTHVLAHPTDCGVCGKHLEHTEKLKFHLRVHKEASFCCNVCGQSFTLPGNLRIHMRIHSGERPHGCTLCGKSFGRRGTLVRHVRSHTGEKPFICTYCGRGFVEKGNLTVHQRTHTGERPYQCSLCDRRFTQLSCFYKHPCRMRSPPTAPGNHT
ncbi:zinc finger protein 235-like [Eleginops maclovinus]|uniref:zinc finger protein 235-like n=1 Tax=Eleginops maclovinus TaxID=56733 RepID=UPI00307FDA5A